MYFRNPHHFKEFKHEHLAALLRADQSSEANSTQAESLKEQLKVYADIEKMLNPPPKEEIRKPATKTIESPPKDPPIKSPAKLAGKPTTLKRARSASPSDSAARAEKKMAPTKSRIETRLEAAAPYNFLLTKIKDNPSTHSDDHR